MNPNDAPHWEGWIPVDIRSVHGKTFVHWCFLGEHRFVEPMFRQTVSRLCGTLRVPQRLTPLDLLLEVGRGPSPAGFIFHMSRCGSTLVSQMLKCSDRHTVVSEAEPINRVLELGHLSTTKRARILRALVGVLGRSARGSEALYFLKLTSWNVLELAVFREAFPEVPWLFIYRDPVEVMAALLADPEPWIANPSSFRRRPGWTGPEPGSLAACPPQDACGAILREYLRAALKADGSHVYYVDYTCLAAGLEAWLEQVVGVRLSPDERRNMHASRRIHSKDPAGLRRFDSDAARKRVEATDAVRDADRRYTRGLYDELSRRARARSPSSASQARSAGDLR